MDAERTRHGIYLVLWHKGTDWPEPEKFDSIDEMMASLEAMKLKDGYCIDVMTVNCTKPIPPSKMKPGGYQNIGTAPDLFSLPSVDCHGCRSGGREPFPQQTEK